MMLLSDVVDLISGTPQFRIEEDTHESAPIYAVYSQTDLEDDLNGLVGKSGSIAPSESKKRIRTSDIVVTALSGDTVFSLLSGTAAIVLPEHDGYLLTQNYVKLVTSNAIDSRYLVYLLNEDPTIRRQLRLGQQGSITMKFTVKQLKALELPTLPPMARQGIIGELYLNQLKLDALRKQVSERETTLVLAAIREANQS